MIEVPLKKSWYFSTDHCAYCLDNNYSDPIFEGKLDEPFLGMRNEVLIPAGKQMFHWKCWKAIFERVTVSK